MSRSFAVLVVATIASVAFAAAPARAETRTGTLDRMWPHPARAEVAPGLGDRVTERLVAYSERFLADPVRVLTRRAVIVGVDPKRQTAKLAVGGGRDRVVAVRLALVVGKAETIAEQVPPRFQPEPGRERDYVDDTQSSAVVESRIALSIAGKRLAVDLPRLEVSAAEYRGTRGVELRLPVVRRRF